MCWGPAGVWGALGSSSLPHPLSLLGPGLAEDRRHTISLCSVGDRGCPGGLAAAPGGPGSACDLASSVGELRRAPRACLLWPQIAACLCAHSPPQSTVPAAPPCQPCASRQAGRTRWASASWCRGVKPGRDIHPCRAAETPPTLGSSQGDLGRCVLLGNRDSSLQVS